MKFVEEYLKLHHLKKHPHKWFLAFLASPIHFAEMHYKKRYHMQFAHARKLFIFDMLLLLTSIVILASGLFWMLYNPTVTDLVYLSIQKQPARILSGDRMDFDILYKNESQTKLVSPTLTIQLPAGYTLEKTEPSDNFDKTNTTFHLADLEPGSEGIVHIFGRVYETPHLETNISASLTYKQAHKNFEEKKITPYIAIFHGSVLKTDLVLANKVLAHSTEPIELKIKNEGDVNITNINISLALPAGINLINPTIKKGEINNNFWKIKELEPNEETTLQAYLNFNLKEQEKTIDLRMTPEIFVNEKSIPQETLKYSLQIIHPNLSINNYWENDTTHLKPGEIVNLYLDLKNNGDTELKNINLNFSLPTNIIDITKFKQNNDLKIQDQTANFVYAQILKPGQSTQIKLSVPVKNYPNGGTDLNLSLNAKVEASLNDITTNYKTNFETSKIKIGTSLIANAEIRYYTNEGDQIGRGPLPAKVGEETKYGAIIQITNGTSRVNNINLSATLPSYIKWTGKSSVSLGNDISFDPTTRKISWSLSSLSANDTAGIYFELSITPDASMINTNPVILKNININVHDTFIDNDLNKSFASLDNSLKTDSIGQLKGTKITQ
ncbi:MAG: hypothetical protein ACD_18C00120G0006 [uncultured bacterium]|nr:MAG: hypothetical protein ACD_18C00120G0006 [uncultured bacterium]OGH88909.1 MAG: hypothetical protein A2507_00240 [Candidatus Magasanikbacteria bacterium RIFOXYD12_FULL_33_17]HAO52785.1 hypothetical protein [Candidatus Magasanikbacteria bacterium]